MVDIINECMLLLTSKKHENIRRFAIPINIVEDLMCHITADSDLADLIRKAKLIIWDEAPMKNRPCEIFSGQTRCYLLLRFWPEKLFCLVAISDKFFLSLLMAADRMYYMPRLMLHIYGNTALRDEKLYESSYSVGLADEDSNFDDSVYTTEFLNGLKMSGVPHHNINLKIAKIISGGRVGTICAIPLSAYVISPSDTKMPFKLKQRQFPL
ncbi:ATP-dependent DNA helicase PIF1-like protein [Tanacetum coccineum]